MKYKNQPDAANLLPLALAFLILSLSGCTNSREQPLNTPPTPPRELYLESQRKVARGEYEGAYDDYQKSVAADPKLANASYLSYILYTWVSSQSEAAELPLLNAQKQVMLTPKQFVPRHELLSVAVNKEEDTIQAFGLGLVPTNPSQVGLNEISKIGTVQKRLLAHEAALVDAQTWVARLATWTKTGVEGPFDVSRTVVGVQALKEFWIGETIFVIKVEAPLEKNAHPY